MRVPRFVPGLVVYDADLQQVGVVAEAFGAIFRLQRNDTDSFWLGAEIVAQTQPGESLTLTISREQLFAHRLHIPMPDRNNERAG